MITTAFVKIWGETAGALAWNEDTGMASFEYDPGFLKLNWDLAPFLMPIRKGNLIYSFRETKAPINSNYDTFKGLPGLIADSLPDNYGNRLINSWLAKIGRASNSMNPVEQLCFIGTRGMGALEFEPVMLKQNNAFNVELDGLVDSARHILDDRNQFETNIDADEKQAIKKILRIGTSAGGARPKAIIAYNSKTGQVKSGQTNAPKGFEHWLIKLDGVHDAQFGRSSGYGRVEMAYYRMALDCGIEMMESRLLEENGRAHFITKRFDREGNSTKHHVQTFCAMRHFDYNQVGAYSYEQLFQTMRMLRLPYPDAEQMYRRMVFNVLARNCDDHTKNFAFRLKKEGVWELAPAYDVCHAYRPDSTWVSQHSLSINGKRKNITKNDLLEVASAMNIKKAKNIIEQILEVVSRWNNYAHNVNVEPQLQNKIQTTLICY